MRLISRLPPLSPRQRLLRWLMGESPNLEEAREASKRVIRDGNRAGEVIARIRALMQKPRTESAVGYLTKLFKRSSC